MLIIQQSLGFEGQVLWLLPDWVLPMHFEASLIPTLGEVCVVWGQVVGRYQGGDP